MKLSDLRTAVMILTGCALLVIAAGSALLYYMAQGIDAGLCGDDVVSELLSPDKKHVATVFTGSCGATTGFTTHVNVRPAAVPYRAEKSGAIHQGEIWIARGRQQVSLEWKETLALEIAFREEEPANGQARNLAWNHVRMPINE